MDSDQQTLLTDEQIEYVRSHLNEFPVEFFDKIRSKDKHLVFKLLDWQPDDNGKVNGVFVLNPRTKKRKPKLVMELPDIIKNEIERCKNSIEYFRDNYVKILTKKGIDFPEHRDYNDRILRKYTDNSKDEAVVLAGRQCVAANTVIDTNLGSMTIGELFDKV